MTQPSVIIGSDQLRRPLSQRAHALRVAAGYALAGLAVLCLTYLLLQKLPAVRVGDGAEYYALERSVSIDHRPYVQDAAWTDYERIRESGSIASMQPAESLRQVYLPLTLGGGTDFNHFWLYPALAAMAGKIGNAIGLDTGTHAHFMLLHAVLAAGLILLCFRLHGIRGVFAALLILISSPALWYLNKVHTEFFTIVLSTAAVACALRSYWATAGLLLAVVTAQNISFVAPALFSCTVAIASFRKGAKPGVGTMWQVVALAAAALIAALHPAYYFFRFGGLTPQLINIGADTSHLNPFLSIQYLLDPDIGLLPNWPAGLLILAAFAIALVRRRVSRPAATFLVFLAIYMCAALVAQAATSNVNSGGTPGPARYALWYLCLFYPCVVLSAFPSYGARARWARTGWMILVCASVIIALRLYAPWRPEAYTAPSKAAKLIYTHAPWMWNPAPEVFSERNAGLGERTPEGPSLIFGPKCRKALYLPGQGNAVAVYPANACGVMTGVFANNLLLHHLPNRPDSPTYFSLDSTEVRGQFAALAAGLTVPATGLRPYLRDGWSVDEPWGVWSDGDASTIAFKTTDELPAGSCLILQVTGLWSGARQHAKVKVRVNGAAWQEYELDASQAASTAIPVALPKLAANAEARIELRYDKPASPAELGMSADGRRMTIGLTSLKIQ